MGEGPQNSRVVVGTPGLEPTTEDGSLSYDKNPVSESDLNSNHESRSRI